MPDAPLVAPTPLQFKDLIAEAGLADRGWAKDFVDKPLDKDTSLALLKKLDGAETLIGKKTLIPDDKSDPKDVEAFYTKLGLEKPEGYDVKGLGEKPDEAFAKEIQAAAHKGRLTQKQLSDFLGDLGPKVAARREAHAAAQLKRDAEFETLIKESAGPEWDKKVERTKTAAAELVPDAAKKFLDKMDNGSLALFTMMTDAILKKYAGEDDFSGKGGTGGGTNSDKESLIKELHTLYASDGWKDFRHADHEKTKKRVDEILASPALKS